MTVQGRRGQHSCPVSLGLSWMRSPDLWDVFSREGVIDMEMRWGKLSEAALNYSASLSIFGRACYVRLRDATTAQCVLSNYQCPLSFRVRSLCGKFSHAETDSRFKCLRSLPGLVFWSTHLSRESSGH